MLTWPLVPSCKPAAAVCVSRARNPDPPPDSPAHGRHASQTQLVPSQPPCPLPTREPCTPPRAHAPPRGAPSTPRSHAPRPPPCPSTAAARLGRAAPRDLPPASLPPPCPGAQSCRGGAEPAGEQVHPLCQPDAPRGAPRISLLCCCFLENDQITPRSQRVIPEMLNRRPLHPRDPFRSRYRGHGTPHRSLLRRLPAAASLE